MAVERLTDYTRRIWTGLAADAPDPDMQAGDVIYYMDTSKCSIITGIPAPGSIDVEDLPDIGGALSFDEVTISIRNHKSATLEVEYATIWYALNGYAATRNSIASNGAGNLMPLNQSGFIILKLNANPIRIAYDTEDLTIEKVGTYVVKFPYMGSDKTYHIYF